MTIQVGGLVKIELEERKGNNMDKEEFYDSLRFILIVLIMGGAIIILSKLF
jgi:hypothetical protein